MVIFRVILFLSHSFVLLDTGCSSFSPIFVFKNFSVLHKGSGSLSSMCVWVYNFSKNNNFILWQKSASIKLFLKIISRKKENKKRKRKKKENKKRKEKRKLGRQYVDIECPYTNGFPTKKKQNANHLSSHPRCACLLFPPAFASMSLFWCSLPTDTRILQVLKLEELQTPHSVASHLNFQISYLCSRSHSSSPIQYCVLRNCEPLFNILNTFAC